ncbi:hypothetical protein ACP70R_033691 [Stipagrostis hirtigluma subsp. patula]
MALLVLLLFLSLLRPATADEQFVFNGFTGANLSLDGMATVTPEGLLMLTNGTSQLKGHAFYPVPLRFHRGAVLQAKTEPSNTVEIVFRNDRG